MQAASVRETLTDVLHRNRIDAHDKLIVAVSGGCDSMVLLALCKTMGLNIIAAHVNFGLRGDDSNEDEQLVKAFCEQANIPLETLRVSDKDWLAHPGSTQEQARSIRYTWFNTLLQQHGAKRILTAHHANDQTETMVHRFIRGGSGKSFTGMAEDTGIVLRPLLSITRKTIVAFATTHHIPWREDISNTTDHYTRNYIRHHVIPLVERLNPGIHDDIQQRSTLLHEEQRLIERATKSILSEITTIDKSQREIIACSDLVHSGACNTLLWHWLQPCGFSSETTVQITRHIQQSASTEAIWYTSETHDFCIQSGLMCLAKKKQYEEYVISELPATIQGNIHVHLTLHGKGTPQFTPDHIRQIINAEHLSFPLIIRPWKDGDNLIPLGAPGRKSVADLLTQSKLPAWEKKQAHVLISNNDIVAVLGVRIADGVKVKESTTEYLQLEFPVA
jgi:tRNA(Ile)-lysidine synthase